MKKRNKERIAWRSKQGQILSQNVLITTFILFSQNVKHITIILLILPVFPPKMLYLISILLLRSRQKSPISQQLYLSLNYNTFLSSPPINKSPWQLEEIKVATQALSFPPAKRCEGKSCRIFEGERESYKYSIEND